ncbi:MAG: copper amine oxidase N-terminal domain-containing protein [Clostridia bacterium]|nr:copper amine oxidase N-terminal domain-containing protein [Clostridia bacterium]
MKKSMKKIIAAASIIAVCATSSFAAFAEYDPNKEVNPNSISTKMIKPIFVVNVNGKLLEGAETYVNENDRIMLPIRAIAEELGFTVGWDSGRITLTKGPVYVTFAIGEDGYTFARTAPMQIGQAPELTDEKTYVPSNFFDEILGGEININQSGQIEIKHGEEAAAEVEEGEEEAVAAGEASVVSVTEEDGFVAVLVNDEALGEVQLNIGEETEITLADGEKGSVADIKEGMALLVEYGAAMTMSLPPQNNPVKITVAAAE